MSGDLSRRRIVESFRCNFFTSMQPQETIIPLLSTKDILCAMCSPTRSSASVQYNDNESVLFFYLFCVLQVRPCVGQHVFTCESTDSPSPSLSLALHPSPLLIKNERFEVTAPSFVFCQCVLLLSIDSDSGARGKCRPRLPGLIKSSVTSRCLRSASLDPAMPSRNHLSAVQFTVWDGERDDFGDISTSVYFDSGSVARLVFNSQSWKIHMNGH